MPTKPRVPKSGKSNPEPHAREDGSTESVSSHITQESRAPVPHSAPRIPRGFRLRTIVDLMLEDRWVRGVTAGELATEWGIALSTVENDSADAGRWIALSMDPEEVKRHGMVHLRRIAEGGDAPAVRAIEIALKATGNLTERLDVAVGTRTGPEMFAAALEHDGFRAFLVEQGWKPPKGRAVITTGSTP